MSMTQSSDSAPAANNQVHTYSAGTLVYEVNLSVPREKAEEYIDWLRSFTKVLLRGNNTAGTRVYKGSNSEYFVAPTRHLPSTVKA